MISKERKRIELFKKINLLIEEYNILTNSLGNIYYLSSIKREISKNNDHEPSQNHQYD